MGLLDKEFVVFSFLSSSSSSFYFIFFRRVRRREEFPYLNFFWGWGGAKWIRRAHVTRGKGWLSTSLITLSTPCFEGSYIQRKVLPGQPLLDSHFPSLVVIMRVMHSNYSYHPGLAMETSLSMTCKQVPKAREQFVKGWAKLKTCDQN